MGYSKALKLHYEFKDGILTFEDGVTYTAAEAIHLTQRGADDETICAIHNVKKIFGGDVEIPEISKPPRMIEPRMFRADKDYSMVSRVLRSLPEPYKPKPKVYSFRQRKADVQPDGEQQSLL